MSEHSLELTHAGHFYFVEIEITETEVIDDSFDHEFGTEERHHTEATDYDIHSVDDAEGHPVEHAAIPGLTAAINSAVHDIDLDE